MPKFGRSLAYNWHNCDLYVCGAGDEIYRLNLETGQFKEPFLASFVGINKMSINENHNLLGFGGESSTCEFFDLRARKVASRVRVAESTGVEVSSFKFDSDGLTLGVGTSEGTCILYDIRSSKPLYTKEHQYGLPIVDLSFHINGSTRRVISSDSKILKIWERDNGAGTVMGKVVTNIEPTANINAVHCVKDKRGDSGLIFMTGDQSRVMSYFAPQLGPAPRWCTYLDSLTEELEETSIEKGGNVYEDYKFVTKAEIEELGATSLIGTPMLRGYMHGFFMEMKLYSKLRAVSKPFEYEEHRKKKIRDKIEEKRASRIVSRKRAPKVNAALAEKLMKGKKDDDLPVDDRFKALFEREEFQQDTEAEDYKLRNPTVSNKQYDSDDDLEIDAADTGLLNRVGSSDDSGSELGGVSDGFDSDDSGLAPRYVGDVEKSSNRRARIKSRENRNDGSDEGEISRETAKILKKREDKKRKVKMFEAASGVAQSKIAFGHASEAKDQRRAEKILEKVPLGKRIKAGDSAAGRPDNSISGRESQYVSAEKGGVVRSLSYIPKSDRKSSSKGKKADSFIDLSEATNNDYSTPSNIAPFGNKKRTRR